MTVTAINVSATPLQLDDNLVNGRTYTFQFEDDNFFTSGLSTLTNDLVASAPDFIGSLQLQPVSLGLTKSYMNVQFTYEGDGSDVVSDVANSMSAAFLSESNDSFSFVNAFAASAADAPGTPATQNVPVVSTVIQGVTDTANQIVAGAGQITNTATSSVFSAALPWLIGAVLIVVVVLPVISKSGLVPKVRVA